MDESSVVQAYFDAMRRGPAGVPDLVALFADDAVYIEPFSGSAVRHEGIDAIRAQVTAGMEQSPPELELTVHDVRVESGEVHAHWSCASPALPADVHGDDRYRVVDGKIAFLETRFRG